MELTILLILRSSPSAEKHVHIVLTMDSREHPNRVIHLQEDKAMNLRRSHSAEKQVFTVLAIESRLGPCTQVKAQHLTAATGHPSRS